MHFAARRVAVLAHFGFRRGPLTGSFFFAQTQERVLAWRKVDRARPIRRSRLREDVPSAILFFTTIAKLLRIGLFFAADMIRRVPATAEV